MFSLMVRVSNMNIVILGSLFVFITNKGGIGNLLFGWRLCVQNIVGYSHEIGEPRKFPQSS